MGRVQRVRRGSSSELLLALLVVTVALVITSVVGHVYVHWLFFPPLVIVCCWVDKTLNRRRRR